MKDTFLKLSISLGVVAILALPFLVAADNDEKVKVCHMTSSLTNPDVEITISVNGLQGHIIQHEGDYILAPEEECSPMGPL